MSKAIHIQTNTFEAEVLQAEGPVLVDFYADWCGPCKALAPVIEELAQEFTGRLKVARLNVDENTELSSKYGVQSIPTLLLFRDGQEVDRIVGFLPKAQLVQLLQPQLARVAA
jgi:thioredoxin 1